MPTPGPSHQPDDERTRRMDTDPASGRSSGDAGAGAPVEATRRLQAAGATGPARDPVVYTEEPWQQPAGDPGRHTSPGSPPSAGYLPPEQPERRHDRGRDVGIGLVGVLLGFLLALVVVALGTDGDAAGQDGALIAAQERIAALEAEMAAVTSDRDALAARLGEAESAAGQGQAELDAQRQALDERAAALDERTTALDQLEATLAARIAEAERAAEEGGAPPAGEPPAGEGASGDGILPDVPELPSLPEIDDGTMDTIVERVLERIRALF